MSNTPEFQVSPLPAGDARALQLRLYREIGVSAVAAALVHDLPADFSEVAVIDGRTLATVAVQKVAA